MKLNIFLQMRYFKILLPKMCLEYLFAQEFVSLSVQISF